MAPRGEEKFRREATFLVAVLLCVVICVAGWLVIQRSAGRVVRDFFYPYLASSRLVTGQLSDLTLLTLSRRELAQRLESAMRDNRRLAAQSAVAAELLVENDELRRMLKLSAPPSWRYIHAEIIRRDPRNWKERVMINRGSEAGVTVGAAALTTSMDGLLILVGVVDSVSRHSAEVITVFNPELRISGALPLSDAVGIINPADRRSPPDQVDIGFLPLKPNYIVDEMIQTSGLERQIPPGVKIGNLAAVRHTGSIFSGDVYLRGDMVPAVNLNRVRFLVIAGRTDPAVAESAPESAP